MNQRKSLRLPCYDYSQGGVYFVTICTQNRRECLSDVCRGGALLRPAGQIVQREISAMESRFSITVDKYVIMPNHIHLLLSTAGEGAVTRAEQSPAPTTGVAMPSLSDMICVLKSVTAKEINRMENTPGRRFWQRSFYDHVIRNERDYLRAWQYIEDNPARWAEDEYFA